MKNNAALSYVNVAGSINPAKSKTRVSHSFATVVDTDGDSAKMPPSAESSTLSIMGMSAAGE